MTGSAARLLALLKREPTHAEVEEVERLLREIGTLEAQLSRSAVSASSSRVALASVTRSRILASASLTGEHGEGPQSVDRARTAWLSANARVLAAVADVESPSLETLAALNAIVCGRVPPSGLRQHDTRLDMEPCPAPADVPSLLAPMIEEVHTRARSLGAVWGAGLLYQWLVSVHPYDDGNGRTARLAADWLLGTSGHLPMTFARPSDAFVALHPTLVDNRSPSHAATVVARAVLRSLRLVTNAPSEVNG